MKRYISGGAQNRDVLMSVAGTTALQEKDLS